MAKTGLGLKAQRGGAVAVVIAVEAGAPVVKVASFIATAAEGDRLALEPYRLAYEMTQAGQEAQAAVTDGRARQDVAAESGMRRLRDDFGAGLAAGLLVNRAGWVGDLLPYSLAFAEHVPVAEGLAVREALRFGLRACGVATAEYDEKTLFDRAEDALGLSAEAIEARLKAMGAGLKPWRKEQKLAALAGWLAAVG